MTGDSPVARFDPRGKVNRALLVGVPEYAFKQPKHPAGVSGDLPAVAHNLTELERVLRAGGVFGPDGVTVSRPRNVDEFDRELYTAAAEAEGLLLLYFSGHGAVPSTGDGLWLQMRRATVVPGAESVFLGAAPWKGVLAVLSAARAEHVVVVLDCCYAGNAAAAWDALGTPQRRRTSLLMSVQANNRIDAGDDDTPTPFTARLVELLERGLRGRGGEVTFAGLADRLRAHMSAHHTTLREPPEPWEPQSRPATSGADVLLAVAARRPPRLPVPPPTGTETHGAGKPSGPGAGPDSDTPPTGGPTGPDTPDSAPASGGTAGPDGTGGAQVAGGSAGTDGAASRTGPGGPNSPGAVGGGNTAGTLGAGSGAGTPGGGRHHGTADEGAGSGMPGEDSSTGSGSGSGATGGGRGSGGRAAGWAFDPRRLATLVGIPAAALSLVFAGLAYFGGADRPPCRPPLELRLLTDPDLEPTVRKAAEAYLASAGNRTAEGCRRSGITVYSAGSAAVITAFGRQSGPWLRPAGEENNPQRDIGPQPDIWIPASPADVERARPPADESAYAELTADPAPFAYSPVVLAVPQNLSGEALRDRTGRLAALTAALRQRDPGAEVRRTDPEHTDAGLLATVALHGPDQDDPAAAERAVAQAGPPARTGVDLLCTLPDDDAVDERTAALVPEFLLRTGVGCDSTTRARRMAAYPADVPGLAPTFVRVRWVGASRKADQRDDAVRRFHDWLTGNGQGAGKGGLAVFGQDGFRSSAANHPPLGADGAGKGGDTDDKAAFSAFGALEDPGTLAGPASPAAMAAALKGYREANGPGRVLFLLDSSGSMGELWTGAGGAPGIISQSLAGLGGNDDYGVWGVASDPRTGRHHTEVLPFGRHAQRADSQRAVAAAPVLDLEADPYRALTAAVDEMARRGTDDHRPQLVVFLTDGEDNGRLAESGRLDGLLQSARTKGVPVVMALLDGVCDPEKPAAALAEASGGRCLDTRGDLVTRLREEVARTGTGDEA
ncbi:VWA domain-containing protein [Streptomyces sp. 2P-4]|uniref:vWA domain-containing protein n=1 Tax=Streptomyces sp. 2P-4 TaxID=2931974 RepID=UPI002540FA70|nr:VWA domain-containing protein [Streptomyces sp. 2P-4]